MKIKNLVILILVIAILLILKFIFFPPAEGSTQHGGQKGGIKQPSIVSVYITKNETIENTIFATGSVYANEEVELKPEISGKVIKLAINEGSQVNKGDLLVKINDAEFQAQLKKAQLSKTLAETQLSREKELLKINGISQQEVDNSQNKANSLAADVEYFQSQIAKTEIKAPFNGTIGLRNISEGAFVTNSTIVATIQQVNLLKIDFFVSERYAGQLKKGSKIEISNESSNQIFSGTIEAVEPKIDLATRTLKVRAICQNHQGLLFPGAFVNVKIGLGNIENTIMIPTESVIPVLKGKTVFIVKNGIAESVIVETGIRTDKMIQITKGISAGDTVIKTGIMQIKPGAPVKISGLK